MPPPEYGPPPQVWGLVGRITNSQEKSLLVLATIQGSVAVPPDVREDLVCRLLPDKGLGSSFHASRNSRIAASRRRRDSHPASDPHRPRSGRHPQGHCRPRCGLRGSPRRGAVGWHALRVLQQEPQGPQDVDLDPRRLPDALQEAGEGTVPLAAAGSRSRHRDAGGTRCADGRATTQAMGFEQVVLLLREFDELRSGTRRHGYLLYPVVRPPPPHESLEPAIFFVGLLAT